MIVCQSVSADQEFVCAVELPGDLTDRQCEKIMRAAENCPERKALSCQIGFRKAQ